MQPEYTSVVDEAVDPDLPLLTQADFGKLKPFSAGLARIVARQAKWDAAPQQPIPPAPKPPAEP